MRFSYFLMRSLALASGLGIALAGCSFSAQDLLPDRRPDYRKSRQADPLEVPPDLTASSIDDTMAVPELNPTGSASLSVYASERSERNPSSSQTVLIQPAGIYIEQEGDRRWLVVEQDAGQLWPKVREFWASNGLPLKREDPRIGIMETDWLENRADIPAGYLRDLLKSVLDVAYSAPTRDRFRVRLEKIPDGTAVYLTHYGVEEVSRGGVGQRQTEDVIWQNRPRDPELEAEMLNRLMVYLGGAEKRALSQARSTSRGSRARLVDAGGGNQALLIDDNYSRAWRLVGLALDSSNFLVENQNRSQGLYLVEYRDPAQESEQKRKEGLLSRLAFWSDDDSPRIQEPGERYQVRLAGQGEQTVVVVLNTREQPINTATSREILNYLLEEIR
jgi:outer membrane protein assembly factor BamC